MSKTVRVQVANQILAHIPDEDLNLKGYAFSSQYIAQEVIHRAGQDTEDLLLKLLSGLASSSFATGMRGQLFEIFLLQYFLPRGGNVTVADFDDGELCRSCFSGYWHCLPRILVVAGTWSYLWAWVPD